MRRTGGPLAGGTFGWVASEMSFGGKPVKGAPYAAEAVTESTQTLSDGNRIQHKSTASVYRDSEGRTRREQTLSAIGPWAASGEAPQIIFIDDSVAGVHYILNPKERTARKITVPSGKAEAIAEWRQHPTKPCALNAVSRDRAERKSLSRHRGLSRVRFLSRRPKRLGKRVIEGVEAEGTH